MDNIVIKIHLSQIYNKYLLCMYYKLLAIIMNYYNYKICNSGGCSFSPYTCMRIFYKCECPFSCWSWISGQNLIPSALEGQKLMHYEESL